MIANEHTAYAEEKRQEQIEYVKVASTKLKSLSDNVSEKEAKKKVERVYDAVYSSPVKSHWDLMDIENRILRSINELEDDVFAGNKEKIIALADSLLTAVNERNLQVEDAELIESLSSRIFTIYKHLLIIIILIKPKL